MFLPESRSLYHCLVSLYPISYPEEATWPALSHLMWVAAPCEPAQPWKAWVGGKRVLLAEKQARCTGLSVGPEVLGGLSGRLGVFQAVHKCNRPAFYCRWKRRGENTPSAATTPTLLTVRPSNSWLLLGKHFK